MSKNETETKQNKLIMGLKCALLGVQLIASILLIVSVLNTGIVSGTITAIIIAALAVLFVLNVVELVIHRKASVFSQIVCGIIAILISIACVFAMRYTDAFNGFLSRITEKKIETKEYSVAVLNSSEFSDLSDLQQKGIGFLKIDNKSGNAEQRLREEIEFDAAFYDDLDTLTTVLSSDVISAITLESNRIEVLQEEDYKALEDIKIIYTFEIELESEDVDVSDKKINEEPFLLYISGSDSREGIKATARSDVNIIAAVNPGKGKILLVSIPRDTYVQLHDTVGLKDKLTHAGIYGIEMSKTTIEDFLDIKIDHTVKVSFDTVVRVVDELDGIDVDSDVAMRLKVENSDKYCVYVEGMQHLDGDCALRFARERKTYLTGDKHRGENQQKVLTSIINKLSSSRDYLLKLPAILDIAADSFETSLSRDDITEFIRLQLQDQTNWKIEPIAIDGEGTMEPTYSMGANLPLYVMIPDQSTVQAATDKINHYLSTSDVEKVEK